MGDTPAFRKSYSTTDVNKSGSRVYDDAWDLGGVKITRRGQEFVLMRSDYLAKMIEDAREGRPNALEDLLKDYDPEKIKRLGAEFLADRPAGKELL
jgi:hypothetical protein